MTAPINLALYRYLVTHGASEDEAAEAARLDVSDLATKADLDARLSALETRIVRTIHTSMIAMTGIFAAFVAAMAWVVSR